jgi:phosphoribosylanthranilate isomerase
MNGSSAKLFLLDIKTMPLKTLVKVGSITNLTDARYCAGMEVDMLGFRAIPGQENYIQPAQFQEIRGWVNGPRIVAEIYGITNPDELNAILENYKPDYLEMSVEELSLFGGLPLPVLLSVENPIDAERLGIRPQYLIGKTFFKSAIPLLIEVHSTDVLPSLLENKDVSGIVLKGGIEQKPGLKDFEVLNDVLELLEIEG